MRRLDDGRVVAAVADGAGSALRSDEGSAAAVAAAAEAVRDGADLPGVFEAACAALGEEPAERAERATTLLVGVLDDQRLAVGQVGDGFAVIRRNGIYGIVGEVDDREYVNETVFLSSSSWRDHLRVTTIDAAAVDACALLTDGLQLVAIELATATPFAGFFDPLFAWLGSGADTAPDEELAAFLASPRLAERTDDDVSLALIRRTR